jgi:hypothetical protein
MPRRLDQTRFPDEIPGSGWDYGSNLDYLTALVHYGRTDCDWRAQVVWFDGLGWSRLASVSARPSSNGA